MNLTDHQVYPMASVGSGGSDRVIVMAKGRGLKLWDTEGNEYLDCMSGLMNVNVGYGREEIAEAASDALSRGGFSPLFYGLTAEPTVALAGRLADLAPAGIERFLFTVGGSDAVDSAIKLVRRFHALAGEPRRSVIVGRRKSYHGMTLGALSAMGDQAYREGFGQLAPGFVHIDQPDADDPAAADALEAALVEVGPENVAAFIAEPISMPAGVAVPPDSYWPRVREICSRHGVLLILDEVITGFGRTGRMLAAEHWDLHPDLLLFAKGITSGYLPLGAVGMTERVWKTAVEGRPFLHGFTAGGHPASCAVALKNIEIIEREDLVANAARAGAHLRARLTSLSARMNLGPVRGLGMVAGLDLVGEAGESAADWLAAHVPRRLREAGLLIRQYGITTMVAPSLIATESQVEELVERLGAGLTSALSDAPR